MRVAIGHSAASPLQIADAVAAGATLATHLGNGCAQMLPRHPNVIWELLAADSVFASLIVDGHHLPPATVKAMVRAKGARSTILVTDATAAAASAAGEYTIGGVTTVLGDDGRLSLPGTPYLAGSSLTMDRAIGNAVRFTGKVVVLVGVTLAAGVATWALSPIKFQADMGILLAFMFLWNMVGAVVLVPALSHFLLRTPTRVAPAQAAIRIRSRYGRSKRLNPRRSGNAFLHGDPCRGIGLLPFRTCELLDGQQH